MTGNQDRAAAARSRTEALCDDLFAEVERARDALKAATLDPKDPLFIQRFMRAVELAAKAAMTVEKMERRPPSGRSAATETEQDVTDRDDSPENLERIRNELMDDFDRIHELLEQKAAAGCDDGGPAAPALEPPAIAA